MATFLRSRLVQDEAVTAGGAVRTDDLPVNPLSAILYTIRAEAAAANALALVGNLLAVMTRIEVIFKGQAIIAAAPADLYALAYYFLGRAPHQGRRSDAAANARVWLTLPILFGRRAYWMDECFPAVRRGELQLQSTPAASFTNLTNPTIQVETIELLEATPRRFLKYTTISKTPSATGDHDVDLPIGNPIIGVELFGTTVPVDGSFNASIGQLRLLVDNVEQYHALTNWETLRAAESLRCEADWQSIEASVRTGAAAPLANELLEPLQWPNAFLRNYAYLDYDPLLDADPMRAESYALKTEGRARVHLRINADTADAIRVIPVEMLAVAAGTVPAV